jgi:malate synthase
LRRSDEDESDPLTNTVARADLEVAAELALFIERKVLPGTAIAPEPFWAALTDIFRRFVPENRALLAERDRMQVQIDQWWQHRSTSFDRPAYEALLRELGYLLPEPAPFKVTSTSVDAEVASMAGPQLVVPALNERFVLNAANARWGSLYDALYGTDALPGAPPQEGYDPQRGAEVIARVRAFLDEAVPLAGGRRHSEVTGWSVVDGTLQPSLADPTAFAGYRGTPEAPLGILFRHHGLGIELAIDRTHPIGAADPAGIMNVLLEGALTTIVDLEDSIVAVDAQDKVAAYANWLGLMRGTLQATFEKNGRRMTRRLAADRVWRAPQDGREFTLPGRALLFVRNVGQLMTTPAVRLPDSSDAPEGILDAMVTALIGMHDLKGLGRLRNSRAGSIYIVKPKIHGPAEAAFTNRLFDAVEDALGLTRHTLKVGLMDEERRTSVNLAACIEALQGRIVFINTGFLDRTGDEIHTSMRAGAMIRKGAMKSASWFRVYEERNVAIGLACGLAGIGQIGKGMWAAPDRMADMLEQKIAHPQAGATTAWVPSPTAATLHALHYHAVDVFARQRELAGRAVPAAQSLLSVPLQDSTLSEDEIREELDNNVQGILGYVVRWVDQGIGCSKVPDIHDVALMEDRATLRISSQHIANWLLHGICTKDQVNAALLRMAAKVDAQNAADPHYRPITPHCEANLAFQAARALIFEGVLQPNGYTELLLHRFRARRKARQNILFRLRGTGQ